MDGLAAGVRSYLCRTVPLDRQLLPVQRRRTHKSSALQVSSPATSIGADEVACIDMDGFSLIADHNPLLQSRGMFNGGTDASMYPADGYAGVANYSSESHTVRTKDPHNNKGKDLFFCDLPEPGDFDDFETNTRNFDPTSELGDFDDTLWSSICSPEAQLVPSSCLDSRNVSSVRNPSTADNLIESSVSVPDQNNKRHSTNTQQQTWSDRRNHILSGFEAHASSFGEIDPFSLYIDAELFGPFDDDLASAKQTGRCEGLEAIISSIREMQVPTASSMAFPDESVATSSTCSGPDLVAANVPCCKRTPDMLLKGMAENPLEMYFPPLMKSEPPEVLTSDTSTKTCQFPVEFAGGTRVTNPAGMQFCSNEMSTAQLHEQPCTTVILEAVPVKDFGFAKLQNGMDQMDVATKGRIRDSLYRLANSVEQRHYAASTGGVAAYSGSKRFGSGRWTETQTNPMDQSVAQLLLQKPPYRNVVSPSRVPYRS